MKEFAINFGFPTVYDNSLGALSLGPDIHRVPKDDRRAMLAAWLEHFDVIDAREGAKVWELVREESEGERWGNLLELAGNLSVRDGVLVDVLEYAPEWYRERMRAYQTWLLEQDEPVKAQVVRECQKSVGRLSLVTVPTIVANQKEWTRTLVEAFGREAPVDIHKVVRVAQGQATLRPLLLDRFLADMRDGLARREVLEVLGEEGWSAEERRRLFRSNMDSLQVLACDPGLTESWIREIAREGTRLRLRAEGKDPLAWSRVWEHLFSCRAMTVALANELFEQVKLWVQEAQDKGALDDERGMKTTERDKVDVPGVFASAARRSSFVESREGVRWVLDRGHWQAALGLLAMPELSGWDLVLEWCVGHMDTEKQDYVLQTVAGCARDIRYIDRAKLAKLLSVADPEQRKSLLGLVARVGEESRDRGIRSTV